MGNVGNNKPASFEEMEEDQTTEAPKTEVKVEVKVETPVVEKTEATE